MANLKKVVFNLSLIIGFSIFSCQEGANKIMDSDNSSSNNSISVSITSPTKGDIFPQSEVINFTGSAFLGNNRQLYGEQLVWSSDKDGIIGFGNSINRSGLSVNEHIITFTASDAEGKTNSTRIPVIIENNPNGLQVLLHSPAAGKVYKSYELIHFQGLAFTPDGSPITEHLAFQWESDLEGILGNGREIEPGGFSPGLHHVTLTVNTDNGNGGMVESTAQIDFLVEYENDPRIEAGILFPVDGSVLRADSTYIWTGFAKDENGNRLTGTHMIWTSSMDGIVGWGETCIVSNLSPGTHRITMTITSSSGKKNTTSIRIEVIQDNGG